jgi:hypothetical protein
VPFAKAVALKVLVAIDDLPNAISRPAPALSKIARMRTTLPPQPTAIGSGLVVLRHLSNWKLIAPIRPKKVYRRTQVC